MLRYTKGLGAREIVHIPYPAYIWRQLKESFSHREPQMAVDAARRALVRHLPGAEIRPAPLAPALHKPVFAIPAEAPRVSVIIPTRNHPDLIQRVVAGVLDQTEYSNLELVIVDNGSDDRDVFDLL